MFKRGGLAHGHSSSTVSTGFEVRTRLSEQAMPYFLHRDFAGTCLEMQGHAIHANYKHMGPKEIHTST